MKMSEIEAAHPNWRVTPIAEYGDVINCCNCGAELVFDQSYTSLQHYTDTGWWVLAECEECYRKYFSYLMTKKKENDDWGW